MESNSIQKSESDPSAGTAGMAQKKGAPYPVSRCKKRRGCGFAGQVKNNFKTPVFWREFSCFAACGRGQTDFSHSSNRQHSTHKTAKIKNSVRFYAFAIPDAGLSGRRRRSVFRKSLLKKAQRLYRAARFLQFKILKTYVANLKERKVLAEHLCAKDKRNGK